MTGRPMSRRNKAIAIVPVALLSGIWTASLVTASTSANAANEGDRALPDGAAVPSKAIEAPASVPIPGVIAPAVPEGTADSVISDASANGIPAPALAAYQRAAQIIAGADKTCNIPWELVAAIGRVESDHGRYGGNTLTEEGLSKPGIYGIALNGKNGTQAIMDTDGGQLDKDSVYDRAVGPMQFIPSTWQVVKVDANGDGKRNPQDINDAALAASVYLCSGSENLGTRPGQEKAVFRYNHSQDYVNLVLRIMEAYSQGEYSSVPSGTYGGTTFTPSYSSAINTRYKAFKLKRERWEREKAKNNGGTGLPAGPGAPGTPSTPGTTPPGTTPPGGNPSTPKPPSIPGGDKNPGKTVGDNLGKVVGGVGNLAKDPVGAVTDVVEGTVGTVGGVVGGVVDGLNAAAASTQCVLQGKTWLSPAWKTCMTNLGFPR